MIFAQRCSAVLMSLAFVIGPCAAASAADLVVIEARRVALKVGQTVDSAKPIALKEGEHLTLISPTGATIKLDGPYNKAPDADQARAVPIANTLALLVAQRQARVGEVGTTRGLAVATLPEPWVLDTSRTGTVCLREGTDAVLWRPDPQRDLELIVAPTDRSWRAQTHWSAGNDRVVIKAPAMIHGDATYLVTLNGTQSAITVENVPASLANDPMRAAWLAGKGCEAQAEALLRNAK
jgi:hypothetical protein